MTTITISLSEDRLMKIQQIAARFGLTVEQLLTISVSELANRSDDSFESSVDYILSKNADLYNRLA